MTDIVQMLQQNPLFESFDDAEIHRLACHATICSYKPGETLLRYQQPADAFWVLISGRAVLLNHLRGGQMQTLETIAAPNLLGWSWLIPPYRWHFDAKAQNAVTAVRVRGDSLRADMAADSALATKLYPLFMALVCERLQAARLQSMDIYASMGGRQGQW